MHHLNNLKNKNLTEQLFCTVSERLALGSVQFGMAYGISNKVGKTKEQEVKKILSSAWTKGIQTIDTASVYGRSEEVIGKYSQYPYKIVTKFSAEVNTENKIKESLESSLKKLNVKEIYGFMAHHAETLLQNPNLWEVLLTLKKKKVVKKIGYSLYSPIELEKLLDKKMIPDIIQVPFNLFDQRFKPFFEELKKNGTEIHARSAFLQGLFFTEPINLPSFFDTVKPLLNKIQFLYANPDELAAFLLRTVLKEKNIDKVVFGVNNINQLNKNLQYLFIQENHPFSLEEYNIPEKILMPQCWPNA